MTHNYVKKCALRKVSFITIATRVYGMREKM